MVRIKKVCFGVLIVAAMAVVTASPALAQPAQKTKQQLFDECVNWRNHNGYDVARNREICCEEVGGAWVVQDDGHGNVIDTWCDTSEARRGGHQGPPRANQGATTGAYQPPQPTTSPSVPTATTSTHRASH